MASTTHKKTKPKKGGKCGLGGMAWRKPKGDGGRYRKQDIWHKRAANRTQGRRQRRSEKPVQTGAEPKAAEFLQGGRTHCPHHLKFLSVLGSKYINKTKQKTTITTNKKPTTTSKGGLRAVTGHGWAVYTDLTKAVL